MSIFGRMLRAANLNCCGRPYVNPAVSLRSLRLTLPKNLSTSIAEEKTNHEVLQARPFSDLPSPNNFLGVNWGLLRDPSSFVDHVDKRVKTIGTIYREKGAPDMPEMLFVVDPEDIEKVYRAGDKGYPMRLPLPGWKESRDELQLPYGMFLESDEKWLSQRVPISKYIMMPQRMADYWIAFNEVSLDLVKYVQNHRDERNRIQNTVAIMKKWALESVSSFVLGKRLGCLEDPVPPDCKEFINSIAEFVVLANKLLFGFPLHKFMRTKNWEMFVHHYKTIYTFANGLVRAKIEDIENKVVKKQEEGGDDGHDFVSHMIQSGKMDIKDIAVNSVDLLSAGVDTTSLTVASCLYCLATNTEVQEKLRNEVREVVGKEHMVTSEHVQNMHYLRDCIKETMRVYPPAPFNGRILGEDIILSGYRIPAGVTIIMPCVSSGRLPDCFPEPEKFKPERWSRENKDLPNSFASLPFGFGRRMCVGRRIAELEIHIAVAQLVRNFRIDYTDDEPLKYTVQLFYYPKQDMNLVFSNL